MATQSVPEKSRTGSSLGGLVPLALAWLTCLAAGVAAWLWNGIDADLVSRADDAGWDESMLLPHQHLLWLACNAAFLLALIGAVTLTILVARNRRLERQLVTV